ALQVARETGDVIVPDWPAPAGVHGFVTTRQGGASQGAFAAFNLAQHVAGDDAAELLAVRENRRMLARRLPASPHWLAQVHGTTVIEITAQSASAEAPVADAAVTRDVDVVLAVLTADCLPVLVTDGAGSAVA